MWQRGLILSIVLMISAHQAPAPLVMGYYVPYDATSWASLQAHVDGLDLVAAQWVTIDPCGNVGSRDDQTLKQVAHANGVRVVPSLFTVSAWLDHQVLGSASAVDQIVSYTVDEGYDGFDLDMEGVDPNDRQPLTDFVAALATALHDQGKMLTLALPAKERDTTTGWGGAFDYAALGAQADLVTIMAYEYRGPFSGPGSVAPYDWVNRVLSFATSQIAPDKVLLGLAFYGYDWDTTAGGARSIGYPQAAALAESVQASPVLDPQQQSNTFTYQGLVGPLGPKLQAPPGHRITVRQAPPCAVAPPTGAAPAPTPTPVPSATDAHEVWFEDSASTAARVQLALRFQTAGVATWRLGLEDPAVWPALRGQGI